MDMDLQKPNEHLTLNTTSLDKGTSVNRFSISKELERNMSDSQFTLEPYIASSRSPEKKKIKRGRKRILEEIKPSIEKFAKFIVISRTEGQSFSKVSPFFIHKAIAQELGTLTGISKMLNG